MVSLRIPVATYRLQFNRQFGFAAARAIVPYLHDLGISDLYASPLLAARQGSPHGYDVTDPNRLNPELGDEAAFAALTGALHEHTMGLLLDIVPNHMAASSENPWWQDVLRNGRNSPYAAYFDIDWQPARPGLAGKVLLPVLGELYGRVLENQELALTLAADGFRVCYHERCLPLSPASSSRILAQWSEKLARTQGADQPAALQLKHLLDLLKNLPVPGEKQEPAAAYRRAWQDFWRLYNTLPEAKELIDGYLRTLNSNKGDPQSFNHLEQILAEQNYRLACWRLANEDINYRRFFDVSDLVSLRVEDEQVFTATHSLIFKLVKTGQVSGLRLDHIDGLHDPQGYLTRLQERLPGAGQPPAFYMVVEKILAAGEELPADWPVFGTTGYDFLNRLNALFVDKGGAALLDGLYAGFSRSETDFATVVYRQKKKIMAELFAGEVRNLVWQLARLAAEDRYGRDLALAELEQALVEVIACLDVYRTYTRSFTVTGRDRNYIERAVSKAVQRHPAAGPACEFLKRVLLLQFPGYLPAEQRQQWLSFVMRWQQFTGPIMAKGFEDTALYIYNRLVSLNEVGGEPQARGTGVAAFHHHNKKRQERWPHTLNTTSTHDTKRSEDVRARINVLSEVPAAWARRVKKWHLWNRPRKPLVNGRPVPEKNTELLIYQTLVGAWPLREEEVPAFKERLQAYIQKAAREAKLHTSWLAPNSEYEKALAEFVSSILEPGGGNCFLPDFIEFQKTPAYYGALNSLAQVLLKITSPGVPDFYQGTELWNFSLVDPDNRRPVDFEARAGLLSSLKQEEKNGQQALAKKLFSSWEDGRIKLYLTYKALQFRKEHRGLFAAGEYIPLEACGPASEHACAFARHLQGDWAMAAVPRLLARMQMTNRGSRGGDNLPLPGFLPGDKAWGDTALLLPEGAPGRWRNILTGEVLTTAVKRGATNRPRFLPLAGMLRYFPVALLAGE